MRLYLLFLMGCLVSQGCQGQPAAQPHAEPAAAQPPKMRPAEEIARLKALDWIGDASRIVHKPFMKRYGESGQWGKTHAGDRKEVVSAGYWLRHAGAAMGETIYPIVDEEADGLHLKVFEGQGFTPDKVRYTLKLEGELDKFSYELAHDKVAQLTWHEASPRLIMWSQGDKKRLWSKPLAISGFKPPMVVGFEASGEVVVEWRGEQGRYERAFYDGDSGEELVRQRLDARIEAVMADPVTFILAAPPAQEVTREMSAVESAIARPSNAMSAVPTKDRESEAMRAARLDGDVVMTAAVPYFNGGREPGQLRPGVASRWSVVVYDFARSRFVGRWAAVGDER